MPNSQYDYVFCVGMRRGGSTLQTQLVSAILGRPTVHLVTPDTIAAFLQDHRDPKSTIVAKSHKFLPQAAELSHTGRARIVYVYRDLRDVVASIVKKYDSPPFSFVHGGLTALMKEYDAWTSVPGIHISSYEALTRDIAGEAINLADFLGIKLTESDAEMLADEFSVDRQRQSMRTTTADQGEGNNQFNSETLLHRDHIQSGSSGSFRDTLAPSIVAALEWQMRDWMKRNQYAPVHNVASQFLCNSMYSLKAMAHNIVRAKKTSNSVAEQ
ncbi:sulfotransferase domain-containing protein [Stieleria varia]|uniref:sulfotransferase domain-containing protein n=1 Tax=Stieleria varia TaxID=2528005 RepID=UPI0018D25CC8|nr:sulfotransferase domain-containing protein [Stieleria varia]